jgi:hypothetical protein
MYRGMLLAVILVVACACAKGAPPAMEHGHAAAVQGGSSALVTSTSPPPPPARAPLPLEISLSASPPSPIKQADLEAFLLEFVVRNTGASTIDPQIERASALLVNGQRAKDWDFTIAGGPRDDRWHALPPGDKLQFTYRFGASLFDKPGRYTLVFEVGGVSSPSVTVVVVAS